MFQLISLDQDKSIVVAILLDEVLISYPQPKTSTSTIFKYSEIEKYKNYFSEKIYESICSVADDLNKGIGNVKKIEPYECCHLLYTNPEFIKYFTPKQLEEALPVVNKCITTYIDIKQKILNRLQPINRNATDNTRIENYSTEDKSI